MKKFMIRADDLGFSKAVNYGIFETVKNGLIKNIGFMVNMHASIHGYELIKGYDVCLGQHTNVCVGKPISDPHKISSLVNENGEFKSSREYRQTKEDFVVLEEAILEVEAQYERFKEITQQEPAYFEAHAVMSQNLMKAIEIVGERHHLKTLNMTFNGTPMIVNGEPMYMHMESMLPDYDPMQSFLKMLAAKEDGYHMMVFHPGYLDQYITSVSSLTTPRMKEVDMLVSDVFKECIETNQIRLYTYDEV